MREGISSQCPKRCFEKPQLNRALHAPTLGRRFAHGGWPGPVPQFHGDTMFKKAITCLAGGALLAAAGAVHAFPDKPITIIVPFSAGSGTDVNARDFAQALAGQVKQPVVVENRLGAEGLIAANALLNAPADGHTLIFTSSSLSVLDPLMKKNLPYDPARDFAPVCGVARIPVVLAVPASSSFKTAGEVVAAAKAQPGKFSFAHSSAALRLSGELFTQTADIKMLSVPYKSTVTALTDLAGGQVDTMHIDMAGGLPFFQSGKIRPLLIAGEQRNKVLPDVPSAAEAGLPDYRLLPWFGVFASAKTPPAVLQQVREAAEQALRKPEITGALERRGLDPFHLCGEALGKYQQDDIALSRQVVNKAGIVPQ
ncbi:Bug family tripartite tricarboxylate transporter substrate binding protein [Pseudorhodoferax sp.]|uniref:Bug family tripartite tricarboxylate transporter substrate binding protein n=1 Tax=Pseudorhodoferax sp. TaxID=1993553 RepID=UPI0039E2875B